MALSNVLKADENKTNRFTLLGKEVVIYGNRIEIDFGEGKEKIEIYGLNKPDFHFGVYYDGNDVNTSSSDSELCKIIKKYRFERGFKILKNQFID
jgi:hypothetical protein